LKEKKPRAWTIDDDTQLITFLLERNPNLNPNDVRALCDLDMYNFDQIVKESNRHQESCRIRWKTHLLPILKTYLLRLPSFSQNYYIWMNDVLCYVIKNKIKNSADINFDHLEKDVCPGQTSQSLKYFVRQLQYKRMYSDEPLHDICSRRLNDPLQNYLTNPDAKLLNVHYGDVAEKIKRVKEIAIIYNRLTKLR